MHGPQQVSSLSPFVASGFFGAHGDWRRGLACGDPTRGTSSNPIDLDPPHSSPALETHTFQSRHTHEIPSPSQSTSTPNPPIPDHEGPEQSADEIKDLLSNIRPDEDIKVENRNPIIEGLAKDTKLMKHQLVAPTPQLI